MRELSAKDDACEDADMEAISFGSIKGVFRLIIGNILGLSPAKLVFVFPFKLLDVFDWPLLEDFPLTLVNVKDGSW